MDRHQLDQGVFHPPAIIGGPRVRFAFVGVKLALPDVVDEVASKGFVREPVGRVGILLEDYHLVLFVVAHRLQEVRESPVQLADRLHARPLAGGHDLPLGILDGKTILQSLGDLATERLDEAALHRLHRIHAQGHGQEREPLLGVGWLDRVALDHPGRLCLDRGLDHRIPIHLIVDPEALRDEQFVFPGVERLRHVPEGAELLTAGGEHLGQFEDQDVVRGQARGAVLHFEEGLDRSGWRNRGGRRRRRSNGDRGGIFRRSPEPVPSPREKAALLRLDL